MTIYGGDHRHPPSLDNTRNMRNVLQKRRLQEGNDAQATPSPGPTTKGQAMGFHPKDQVRANSKQCLHQGNDTKNVAIIRYNQLGSNLGFSPRSSRSSTREVLPNQSHPLLSPSLSAIPAIACAQEPLTTTKSLTGKDISTTKILRFSSGAASSSQVAADG